jgi:hypothetical protein
MPAIEMTPESSTTGRFRNRPLVMFRSAFALQDRQQRHPGREVTDRGQHRPPVIGGDRSQKAIRHQCRAAGPDYLQKSRGAVAAATIVLSASAASAISASSIPLIPSLTRRALT